MKEVNPGIFLIKEIGRFKTIKPQVNIYVIPGSDGIIFDAGYGDRKTIKHVENEIKLLNSIYNEKGEKCNISQIYISHCHPDHFSGLKKLRKRLKLKIVLTKDQKRLLKNKQIYHEAFDANTYEDYLIIKKGIRGRIRSIFERFLSHFIYRLVYRMTFIDHVDEIIDNNTQITVNGEKWSIFASPGHSSDHISLYNEERGILISGDIVLSSITTWLGPPNSDLDAYIKTIQQIQNLPKLDIILPAHGKIISNPHQRIKEILDHRKERTVQILEIITRNGSKGTTPVKIIKTLYPAANKMLREFARGWICLTLKSLEKQNLITRKEVKNRIYFYPVDE
jgi:glyoxylase-like metal-dependent hydrolase (beta-lactamase superfamily II)